MAEAKKSAKSAKSISKSELVRQLAESTGLAKKDVSNVLETLSQVIAKNVGKKGPGVISLLGLMKVKVVTKKATPARKNVPNPFKPGEFRDIPAKPARKVVKILPLKALKDMA